LSLNSFAKGNQALLLPKEQCSNKACSFPLPKVKEFIFNPARLSMGISIPSLIQKTIFLFLIFELKILT
jgi:hypothetical protein